MLGDAAGEAGVLALEKLLAPLKTEYQAALTVVNGENAAGGFGMTEPLAKRIFAAGADVITSGNHIWEKREFLPYLSEAAYILRPANYPAFSESMFSYGQGAPGKGFCTLEKDGAHWLVINLQGREFMTPVDCPFRAFDTIYAQTQSTLDGGPPPIVVVDFHAESGREKEALAFYTQGRAACIAGTHTHVQTADERILPFGTAYITDLGMSGAEDSIIGMNQEICLERLRTQVLYKLECAGGPGSVQGIAVSVDIQTGKALSIERFARSA